MNRTSLSLILASLLLAAVPAHAQDRVKSGTLDCDVSGGLGMIIGSQKAVHCTYVANNGSREAYSGTITKFGLDIGATQQARLVWAVFAPAEYIHYGLAGTYAGATAEATVGAGVGANLLVGGSQNAVSLQPLSVTGQTGLNIAAGVGSLKLQPAGK